MRQYVVGFLYADTSRGVVLIRKARPDWQAGLLNGVGGKLEGPETHREAMVREFYEETGVLTTVHDWTPFCTLWDRERDGEIVFLACLDRTHELYEAVESKTDEQVEKWAMDPAVPAGTVPNLRWLLPMGWYHVAEREVKAKVSEGTARCQVGS